MLLCKLLVYAMITYRLFRVNAFRVYNKGMKDGFNMSKALIAFYSRADENYVNGDVYKRQDTFLVEQRLSIC